MIKMTRKREVKKVKMARKKTAKMTGKMTKVISNTYSHGNNLEIEKYVY